ncbi:OmpA family protein [Hoeflea sp. 108]|jgi:OOP family OmpA-OmpF porin|uniref:OmpA family protein n=1 Tax=Hoeflea sp. 108 TaxID=1116369 RepID=UPI0003A2820A|nr:OmpA family protein [Hoeflea sp. 108]
MTGSISRGMRQLLAAMILVAAGCMPALADATVPTADIEGSADNALAKRYDGSFIVYYQKLDYTDFTVPMAALKADADPDKRDKNNNRVFRPEKAEEVEGTLTRIFYVLPDGRSPLEVLRNYQDVVQAAGGEVAFECKKEECGGDASRSASSGGGDMSLMMNFFYDSDLGVEAFSNAACAASSGVADQRYFSARVPRDGGDAYVTVQTFQLLDDLYCKELNGRTVAMVHVIEPKARDKKMVLVEAAKMADSLSTSGGISLYGIFFDTDKADIKPESEPTLKEIAKLLGDNPALAVAVVGHTDNQGKFDYNIDLSNRRAAAVKSVLVSQYGIDAGRLTAAGAGMMAPVATNDNDEGRAKNRRVALVKLN